MIKKAFNKEEKEYIIEACDTAFPKGICNREDKEEIINKIDKCAVFFADYEDDVVTGYAAMYCNDLVSRTAYITMIGVRKEYQGKKIGRRLMDECKRLAHDSGMEVIRLEVHNTNEKAISFYKHNGFIYEKKCSDDSNYMIYKFEENENVEAII